MGDRMVLFGGTFDPIHHGHLIAARAVAEYFHFERITFVPVAAPPHLGTSKAAGASGADRLEMIRLAIAGEALLEASDVELSRGQPSYTFDTLAGLREEHGLDLQLCWIIGTDMLADLPRWHRAGEVVDMARLITVARPPYNQRLEDTLGKLRIRFTDEQVERLTAGMAPTPLIDITSTQIRHRLRDGKSVRFLTPGPVVEYILRCGLYGTAARRRA